MTTVLERYQRIAPYYDLLDLPFEVGRYRRVRPRLFAGLSGDILDAGVGTGRNAPFHPAGSSVVGIDLSPAMLARAERRRAQSAAARFTLQQMDVTGLDFADRSFDAAVSAFLFCVLDEALQAPALAELRRVVRPGGTIRLLEYVHPRGRLRRVVAALWAPWVAWAYGAGFDRDTRHHIPEAGLELTETVEIVPDLMLMLTARVPC